MQRKSRRQHDQDVDALRQRPAERGRVAGVPSHMTQGQNSVPARGFRHLNAIIELTPEHALVEPGITMDDLAQATLKYGYIPKVLPEFKEITVGGAIMGAGLESSSFRCGQFNDICSRYELVLGSGELKAVSPTQEPQLFYGISGSYGSLASMTLAEVQLEPAHPLMELRTEIFADRHLALEALSDPQGAHAIDAMLLPTGSYAVMRAFPSKETRATLRLARVWDPWFCQYIIERSKQAKRFVDHLPTYDYLFRYDRGAFWMGQFATRGRALWRYVAEWRLNSEDLPRQLHQAFRDAPPTLTPPLWLRSLLGWKLSSSELYKVLHALPGDSFARCFLVQDYYLPRARVGEFIECVNASVAITPLWLCPIKGRQEQPFAPHHSESDSDFVNVGVYGVPKQPGAVLEHTRALEQLCNQLGGRKMLYGVNRYDEESFWSVYPKATYTALRERYHAEGVFPDLYQRVGLT